MELKRLLYMVYGKFVMLGEHTFREKVATILREQILCENTSFVVCCSATQTLNTYNPLCKPGIYNEKFTSYTIEVAIVAKKWVTTENF